MTDNQSKEQPIKGKEEILKEIVDSNELGNITYMAMEKYAEQFRTPIAEGEERLFTLKDVSEFAPWFKKNTAMKDEEGWIPTTFCGLDYKKSYTVEQFYKYFKEKSLLSSEQNVQGDQRKTDLI